MRSFVSNATGPRGGGADAACVDSVRSAGGGSDDELAEPLLDSGGLSSSSSLSDCTTYFRFARAKPDFFAPEAEVSPAREDCSLRVSWRIAASWASSFGCRGACGEDSMGCDCSVASWPVGPCVTEAGGSRRDGPSSGCSLIAKVRLTGPEDRSTCRASRVRPFLEFGTLASCGSSDLIVKTITSGNARFLPLPRKRCSRPSKLFH